MVTALFVLRKRVKICVEPVFTAAYMAADTWEDVNL